MFKTIGVTQSFVYKKGHILIHGITTKKGN